MMLPPAPEVAGVTWDDLAEASFPSARAFVLTARVPKARDGLPSTTEVVVPRAAATALLREGRAGPFLANLQRNLLRYLPRGTTLEEVTWTIQPVATTPAGGT